MDDGRLFIVMPFYAGETLKKKIARGPLPVEEAVDYAIQIARGLTKTHAHDIIHRDIKPANVMVTSDGVVKVVDFGLAKLADVQLTKTGTTLGTVAYMSPEQAQGVEVDARTDLWSLGVVLYEMLTGERPFLGEYEQAVIYLVLNVEAEPVEVLRPEVPEALAQLVHRTLTKDRDARPASMVVLLDALKALQADRQPSAPALPGLKTLIRQPRYVIPGLVLLLVLGAMVVWWYRHSTRVPWARQVALPEIARLADGGQYAAAFELATEAERFIANDSTLAGLWPRFSGYVTVHSDPAGTTVYSKPYTALGAAWQYLGQTPIDSLRVSYAQYRYLGQTPFDSISVSHEHFRFKVEKDGFHTINAIPLSWVSSYKLGEEGSIPVEMVRVSGGTRFRLFLAGLSHLKVEHVSDFLMDTYEVSNRAYKRFVGEGGYRKREYWKHPFVKEGRTLSWEEAMALFMDKTGRFVGPSTWVGGDYPEGEDAYPVTGVSWYEAAAYAEFVGKSLPTIYHWNKASGISWGLLDLSYLIIPLSNFDGRGPAPGGNYQGIGPFGTYDLAGNVREWAWNAVRETEQRFILGGSWNDPPYMYSMEYGESAFDRSPTNGFRCVDYIDEEEDQAVLSRPIAPKSRDYTREVPVSDELFEVFLRQYAYDPAPLNPAVESVDASAEDWTREKITFDAAYGNERNERMVAYLYLPKGVRPPYQPVLFFPGAYAIPARSFESWHSWGFDFLLRSGRAVMVPIYKGTYERGDDLETFVPDETNFYKEHVIMWAKDLNRSIDYLEMRDDIDTDKLAYYGISWGGLQGPIMLAVEKRFKVGVLHLGGLPFQRALPEVDPINFLPRVTIPVLMHNGRYDYIFPLETSQRPLFELLGTPEEQKRHVVFESAHTVPRSDLIRETLDWLDHYLGPVE